MEAARQKIHTPKAARTLPRASLYGDPGGADAFGLPHLTRY